MGRNGGEHTKSRKKDFGVGRSSMYDVVMYTPNLSDETSTNYYFSQKLARYCTCFRSTELNFCRRKAFMSMVPGGFPMPTKNRDKTREKI